MGGGIMPSVPWPLNPQLPPAQPGGVYGGGGDNPSGALSPAAPSAPSSGAGRAPTGTLTITERRTCGSPGGVTPLTPFSVSPLLTAGANLGHNPLTAPQRVAGASIGSVPTWPGTMGYDSSNVPYRIHSGTGNLFV